MFIKHFKSKNTKNIDLIHYKLIFYKLDGSGEFCREVM